jgi:hypothetical protein
MSQVLTDCFVAITTTDAEPTAIFSGPVTGLALSTSADTVEISEMGNPWRGNQAGAFEWSLSLDFNCREDDITAIFSAYTAALPVSVEVRATSAARSATNPSWVGEAVIVKFDPVSGSFGDKHAGSLDLTGNGELQRLTTEE